MRTLFIALGLPALVASALAAQTPDVWEGPLPVKEPVVVREAAPPARFYLLHRDAGSTDGKHGLGHVAGGFIELTAPSPDTVVVSMTGVTAAAGNALQTSDAELNFELTQEFRVAAAPGVAAVRLVFDAQLIGLLRCQRPGAGVASTLPAEASIEAAGGPTLLAVAFPGRSQDCEGNQFVNDRFGPVAALVPPGCYTLHQRFGLRASHPKRCFHKNTAIAAFGPDSPRPPDWLSLLDPNRDLPRQRDLGFRVMLRLQPETGPVPEQLPLPQPVPVLPKAASPAVPKKLP